MSSGTKDRKADHLRLALSVDSLSTVSTGFERWRLVPAALPELSLDQIDLGTGFLGRRLRLPFLIPSMTAGTDRAVRLNARLAASAAHHGLGLALGSLRAVLDGRTDLSDVQLRPVIGQAPLLGNIGVWQLRDPALVQDLVSLAAQLELDGIFVHLNSAQELVQPEGERDFRGAGEALASFCDTCPLPVLVKEVGFGLSLVSIKELTGLPIAGLDVAGLGGTNFALIEAARNADPTQAALGRLLAGWGVPTAEALTMAVPLLRDRCLIASGGIFDALAMAKALALGADLVSTARPILAAAQAGDETLDQWFDQLSYNLRCLTLLVGAPTLAALQDGTRIERCDHV